MPRRGEVPPLTAASPITSPPTRPRRSTTANSGAEKQRSGKTAERHSPLNVHTGSASFRHRPVSARRSDPPRPPLSPPPSPLGGGDQRWSARISGQRPADKAQHRESDHRRAAEAGG
eukprot:CAMPEP_0185402770 /NCGR_PEP_ID=MMETSP1364-20130426/91961_1 /TAXON_ID=38817 /ORGANISM="Gephyrocapsa oceanica, Strain RCC1303" /LENGTH=116 /DNA_ID=CAMNT_0028005069 /DNA_START=923 /DNA_END=1269 /DNA_ORIENTATION=+